MSDNEAVDGSSSMLSNNICEPPTFNRLINDGMGHVICIASQKGGVGKTTTAVNFSTALAVAEKKTLLIDSDPLGHATAGMGVEKDAISGTLYHGLLGHADPEALIIESDLDFLSILPARVNLFRAETELLSRPDKERILKNFIGRFKERYDYTIIDSPPSLSLLAVNAMIAADAILIPLQCEYYALAGMGHLLKTIQILKKNFNPELQIAGILLTMFDAAEPTSRKIAEMAQTHFRDRIFKTVIPRTADLRESAIRGKPLLLYDMRSRGAQSYLALASEFLAMRSKIK